MTSIEFKRALRDIWPYIYRGINTSLYFLLSVLKSVIANAIRQLKGM